MRALQVYTPMPAPHHRLPTGARAPTPAAGSSRISQACPRPLPSCAASCASLPPGEPAAACALIEQRASGLERAGPFLMAGCRLEPSPDASRLRGGPARGGAAPERGFPEGAALERTALERAVLDGAALEGAVLVRPAAAAAWRPSRSRLGSPSANTSARSSTGVSIPGPLLPQGSCSHRIGAPIGADQARTCFQPALLPRGAGPRTSMRPAGWVPAGASQQGCSDVELGRGPDHRGGRPQGGQPEAGRGERLGGERACDIRVRWGEVDSLCDSAVGEGGEISP